MSDRSRSPLGAAARIAGAVLFGLWFPSFVDATLWERLWSDIPAGHTFILDSWIVAAAVSSLVATAMALLILRETRAVSPDRAPNLALGFMVLALTAYFFEAASPQGGFQMEVVGPVIPVPWNLARGLIRALGVLSLGLPVAGGFLWRATRGSVQLAESTEGRSPIRRALILAGILLVTIVAFYLAWGAHFLKALESGAYEGHRIAVNL